MRLLSALVALLGCIACSGSSSSPSASSNLCAFSLMPGPFAIAANGGHVEVALATQAGCIWNSEAMDFLSRPSADSTGNGSRTFQVDVPPNVGGRRQGRFRIQGFVGAPNTNKATDVVTQYATIDQDPLVVPVPAAPNYLYYAAPYPSWGGVTRVIRDGVDAVLQVVGIGQSSINVVVRPLSGPQLSLLSVSIGAPTGQTLQPGAYEDALRLSTPSNPSIDFDVDSSGCNQTFGRFTVQDVLIGGHAPSGGGNTVIRLRASFEVGCESATAPRTVGEIWYVAP